MFGEFMIEMDEQYLAYRGWYGVVTLPKNYAYSFCHCKWICNSSVPFALSFFVSFVTSLFRACDRLNVRVYVAFVGLFVRSLVRSCVHAFLLSCGHAFLRSFVRVFVHACVRWFVRSCVRLLVCSWIRACVRPSSVCQLDTWLLLFLSFVPFRFVHRRVLLLFSSEISAKLLSQTVFQRLIVMIIKGILVLISQISTSGPRALWWLVVISLIASLYFWEK